MEETVICRVQVGLRHCSRNPLCRLGPLEIVKKIGKVAYELKLPANMMMHDVLPYIPASPL